METRDVDQAFEFVLGPNGNERQRILWDEDLFTSDQQGELTRWNLKVVSGAQARLRLECGVAPHTRGET